MKTVHLLIKGNVQGVFYRATAKKMAYKLKITGWIKNTPNGDVEALASGEEATIDKFIDNLSNNNYFHEIKLNLLCI